MTFISSLYPGHFCEDSRGGSRCYSVVIASRIAQKNPQQRRATNQQIL